MAGVEALAFLLLISKRQRRNHMANNNTEVTFEIMEHVGVIEARKDGLDQGGEHCLLERRPC